MVTKEAYPRDHVEDEMVYSAFQDALNEYARKAGEEVGNLGISVKLTPDEWKLVSPAQSLFYITLFMIMFNR